MKKIKGINNVLNSLDKKGKLFLISSLVMTFLTSLLTVLQPLILTRIIDDYNNSLSIWFNIILAAIAHIIARYLSELRWFVMGYFEGVITKYYKALYLEKILLKLPSFLKVNPFGEIAAKLSYIDNSVSTVSRNLSFTIIPLILNVIILLTTVLISFSNKYLLILVVSFILYFIVLIRGSDYFDEKSKLYINAYNKTYNILYDLLLNRNLLRFYNIEDYELKKYKNSLQNQFNASIKHINARGWFGVIQASVLVLAIIITLFTSGYDLNLKTITIGEFILINTYLLQLLTPLEAFSKIFREVKNSLFRIKLLNETIDSYPNMIFGNQEIDLSNGLEVEFKNVSFKHPDSEKIILDNVSFKFKKGEFIAIVGESGSGKSTITNLITRLYEPNSGEILFNNINIKNLSRNSFHSCFSNVSQISQILTDNVENNLTLGENVAYENICKTLGIDNFVNKLPDGYETKISMHDKRLSEGQLQRINLVRGIIADKPLLLLDEVTSSLDKITEQEIVKQLKNMVKHKTVIYITHKLNITPNADLILVLNQGRVVEVGNHESLLKNKGIYYNLWNSNK